MKKIVRGNDFTLRIQVCKIVNGEQVAFPLPACTDIVVNIVNQYRRVNLAYSIDTAEDNIINARVEGDAVSVGTYALEIRGKIFGNDWRSKEYEQFAIVDNNASGDTAFNGELIEGEDSVEMNTALVFLPPTAELTQLINDANAAVETAKQTDATLKANESVRVSAEQQRVTAESSRVLEESKATEAERVNAELNGNMLVVTDRNGDVRTLDFEQWDLEERVNITITTSVAGVSVKGVAVNVFLNGSSAFTKYTTDADGKVSFTIPRGTMYRIAFQELKGCDPLPSLTYTAALRVRDINVEYKPVRDEKASVVVTIDKAENEKVSPFEGVAVTCAIANGDTITTETDSEGQVTFRMPYNKKYKITAAQKDGYYAFRGVYEKNNVADVAEHNLYFYYYPTTSGVFILDATGAQYTADEWQASGKTAEEAVLIKLVTQNLANGNNCFGFSPAALQNGYPSKQWCTQTVLFNNIPANGKDTNDALYYDGYKSSKLIREEAQERNLTVPAFSFAYDCTVEMAGETLHGYMVSFGQAAEMFINKAIVDDVIKVLYGSNAQQLSSLFSRNLWTSTQGDVASAWFLSDKLNNRSTKPHDFCVIPVFAC